LLTNVNNIEFLSVASKTKIYKQLLVAKRNASANPTTKVEGARA
jgi:hypothetical protein